MQRVANYLADSAELIAYNGEAPMYHLYLPNRRGMESYIPLEQCSCDVQTSMDTLRSSTYSSPASCLCRGTNAIDYTKHNPTEEEASLITNKPPV
jgi:hypothetical protein